MEYNFNDICLKKTLNHVKMFLAENPSCYVHNGNDSPFRYACRFGKLDLAQWLLENYPNIDIHAEGDYAFRYACEEGHLDVAKWLINTAKTPLNVHAYGEDAFISACKGGHLEVVKWLLETFPDINIHEGHDEAFYISCRNGRLEMVKFLQPMYTIDEENCRKIFFQCMDCLQFEVVEWVCQTYNFQPADREFYEACNTGHLKTVKWFLEKFPDASIDPRLGFLVACQVGDIDLVDFLAKKFPQIASYDQGYKICRGRNNLPLMRWFLENHPEIEV